MVPLCPEKFSLLLFWSKLVHDLPSRCMPPSLRSAPSSKLPPLYVPVSPVARAARCKPCPVVLVPTLGCSRPPARNLDLLTSALSGRIIPEHILLLKSERLLNFADASSHPARKEAPPHPNAFARASTIAGPRGGRAPDSPCLYQFPRTHGKIRGPNGPGMRASDSHTDWKC